MMVLNELLSGSGVEMGMVSLLPPLPSPTASASLSGALKMNQAANGLSLPPQPLRTSSLDALLLGINADQQQVVNLDSFSTPFEPCPLSDDDDNDDGASLLLAHNGVAHHAHDAAATGVFVFVGNGTQIDDKNKLEATLKPTTPEYVQQTGGVTMLSLDEEFPTSGSFSRMVRGELFPFPTASATAATAGIAQSRNLETEEEEEQESGSDTQASSPRSPHFSPSSPDHSEYSSSDDTEPSDNVLLAATTATTTTDTGAILMTDSEQQQQFALPPIDLANWSSLTHAPSNVVDLVLADLDEVPVSDNTLAHVVAVKHEVPSPVFQPRIVPPAAPVPPAIQLNSSSSSSFSPSSSTSPSSSSSSPSSSSGLLTAEDVSPANLAKYMLECVPHDPDMSVRAGGCPTPARKKRHSLLTDRAGRGRRSLQQRELDNDLLRKRLGRPMLPPTGTVYPRHWRQYMVARLMKVRAARPERTNLGLQYQVRSDIAVRRKRLAGRFVSKEEEQML